MNKDAYGKFGDCIEDLETKECALKTEISQKLNQEDYKEVVELLDIVHRKAYLSGIRNYL